MLSKLSRMVSMASLTVLVMWVQWWLTFTELFSMEEYISTLLIKRAPRESFVVFTRVFQWHLSLSKLEGLHQLDTLKARLDVLLS